MAVHNPREDRREIHECRVLLCVGAAYTQNTDAPQIPIICLDDCVDKVLEEWLASAIAIHVSLLKV